MNIYGYARLSKHTEESTSIARQREVIAREVEKRGDTLAHIYEDVDVSALKRGLDRPGLTAAREAVEREPDAALMVWRLDRVARSVSDFMTLVDGGVEVISATEPIDTTTPMGRAMAQVLQVFAELESRTTGLRVASSKAYLRRVGRFPGGRVPYGYKTVPHPEGVGYALAIEPEEAKVIREVVDKVLSGTSLYKATLSLNQRKVLTRAGKPWDSQTVKRIVLGPAVLGRVAMKGDVVRDERGVPVEVWPAIVTVEEAARLRARITRAPAGKRRKRAEGLLSGLAVCGGCQGSLNYRRRHTKAGMPSYGCRARARGQVCDVGAHIKAEFLETQVEEEFKRRFGMFKVTEVIESAPEVAGLAVVEEAIRDTLARMADEDADLPALMDQVTDLREERTRLKAQPQEVQSVAVETDQRVRERWDDAGVKERRMMLRSFGLQVTVHKNLTPGENDPDRVEIGWLGRIAG